MATNPHKPLPNEPVVGEIRQFLVEMVEGLTFDERAGRGRPRILPALSLWVGFVLCVLEGFGSQRGIWRLVAEKGIWNWPRVSISDEAVYKRLKQGGTQPLEDLFEKVSAVLAGRLTPWVDTSLAPFATDVVALDATTVDPLARKLTDPSEAKTAVRPLAGRLLGAFDVRRQQWLKVLYRPNPDENEKLHARDLLEALKPGTLILADLGFFSFAWFDELTERGFWWLSRGRAKTSYKVIHTYYEHGETRDDLVMLGAHRADRTKHTARRMQFRQGANLRVFLTNVNDPTVLSIHDAATLYARRWDIEMAVQMVKQHLKLRLLWSNNLVVVQQQIWATLIIAQIISAMRMEIAGRAGVDIFEVSLPLLIEYLPKYASRHEDPLAVFLELGRELEFIRPSRRIHIKAPLVDPASIRWPPDDIPRTQVPRYARRRPHGPASK